MLWAAVNRMIEGETLEQAVDYAKSIYGTDDIIWYNEQGGRRPMRRHPMRCSAETEALHCPTPTRQRMWMRRRKQHTALHFCTKYIILKDGRASAVPFAL